MATSGRYGWTRTALLTVGIALLGLTLLPPAARAEINDGRSDSAAFLAKLCRAGGGTAIVVDTPEYTTVACYGGVYGGMGCYISPAGTFCSGVYPHPVRLDPGSQFWPIDETLPVLENGAPEQITRILADLEAGMDQGGGAGQSVDSSANQDHQQDTTKSKGKKGKHGKKGGKYRKH